jgi:hypothetical protein
MCNQPSDATPDDGGADPAAALVAIRRLLSAEAPHWPANALDLALEYAEERAVEAWEDPDGRPPGERLSLARQAAAEALEEIGMRLAGDGGEAESSGRGALAQRPGRRSRGRSDDPAAHVPTRT